MNTLAILTINAITIVQLWIVSLRRTVNLKSISLFFFFGLFGTTIIAFILHFLTTRLMNPKIVSYTINPFVEESVKIIPVLLFLWFYRKARQHMGILDIMLLALAAGTGFEVGETLLYAMGHSSRDYSISLWLPQITTFSDYDFDLFKKSMQFVFAGHGIMAAAIGAGIGFAFYMKTIPRLAKAAWAVPLGICIWAVYDHIMVNYLLSGSVFGMFTATLNPLLQVIYYFDQAGRLIINIFTISILLAIYLEERLIMAQLESEKHLRLAGEKSAIVLVAELQVAVDKIFQGWQYLRALFTFYGLRRQLAYYKYFIQVLPGMEEQAHLDYLRSAIGEKLERLREMDCSPDPEAWNFKIKIRKLREKLIANFKTLTVDGWLTVVMIVMWVVLFVIQPTSIKRQAWFYYMALLLAMAGALRAIVVYLHVLKAPKVDISRLDANTAIYHFSVHTLSHLSMALIFIALIAYFVPLAKIINELRIYFLWYAFRSFYNTWGMYLPSMLAINAGLLSAIVGLLIPGQRWWAGAESPAPTPTPGTGTGPTPVPVPAPTPEMDKLPFDYAEVIKAAEKWLGTPYLYSGENIKGIDCSGFVHQVLNQIGIKIEDASAMYYCEDNDHFTSINEGDQQPGDLVFFYDPNNKYIAHVGFVVDEKTFIGAQTSTGVTEARYDQGYWHKRQKLFRRIKY